MNRIPNIKETRKCGLIPLDAGRVKSEESPEVSPFFLSYQFYNDNLCELDALQKNAPKEILRIFRNIGRLQSIKDFMSTGIDSIPVDNNGDYKKLFNKLPIDVDLKEHKIQGSSRLFYYVVRKIVHIVCIKNTHLETKKNRR